MRDHGDVMDSGTGRPDRRPVAVGLLQKTLIVMLSEFGRTPKINVTKGRDHHPTVVLRLRRRRRMGGQVIGTPMKRQWPRRIAPAKVPDLHASICHASASTRTRKSRTNLQRPMKLRGQRQAGERAFS